MSDKLGKNIRYLREFYGETQEELAEFLGKGKSGQISDYENGKIKPSTDDVVKIAAHYQVTVDNLRFDDYSNLKKHYFFNLLTSSVIKENRIIFLLSVFPILFLSASEDLGQKKLLEHHFKALVLGGDSFDYCVEHYIVSPSIEGDYYKVNRLSFLFFFLFLRTYNDVPWPRKGVKKRGKKQLKQEVKGVLLGDLFRPSTSPLSEEEYHQIIELMIELEASSFYEVRQLVAYLNAMFYFWGFVDNDSTIVQNRLVGWEMLVNLIRLENPWAIGFAEAFKSFANLG